MDTLLPLITPFNKDLQVDYKALDILLEYTAGNKILVNSWIGEVYSLTPNEYISILSYIKGKTQGEIIVYIPSYKYCLRKLLDEIKGYYGTSTIDDTLMVELDLNDKTCRNELCLARQIAITLNNIYSKYIMLYIRGDISYNRELIEIIRGLLRIYPELTHIVIDQDFPLSLVIELKNTLNDLDREIDLYLFGDYILIASGRKVFEGTIAPIGLLKNVIEKKHHINIEDTTQLTRITDYANTIIGAIKAAINILEPSIKEYTRPPIPAEFPTIRDYIKSIINYYTK